MTEQLSPDAGVSFWLTRRYCRSCRRWMGLLHRIETPVAEVRCPRCGGATEAGEDE